MKKKKLKRYKPQKPLKIIERVIDEVKDTFNIYKYFNIDDNSLNEKERIEFVYGNWDAIEFKHDFADALFGESYPTGELREWMFCEKCNKMTVITDKKDDNINMEDFIYCPKCGVKTKYHVQKVMYNEVYIHRLRDTVAMENKDQRLQYTNQMLNLKEENKRITELLDKKLDGLTKKFNKSK